MTVTASPEDTVTTLSRRHRFAVAPMLDWTDRHCRYLLRQFSRRTLLYTEMVTTGALLQGDSKHHLAHDTAEHPLALQLGGSDTAALAECARMGEDAGYDEINLNVGCPSDRVQSGRFGACLMAEPALVADCVATMQSRVSIPVTVKTRTGIDRQEDIEQLFELVSAIVESGCRVVIIHARNAWLQGLSPKENRDIPPLNYEYAYRIKSLFPELTVVVNGGIHDLDSAEQHLAHVDGVMLGRAAYRQPRLLADVDRRLFGDSGPATDEVRVVEAMLDYAARELKSGTPLKHITRHMLSLFQGRPGARRWRRHLGEQAGRSDADIRLIREALSFVEPAAGEDARGREYG